jgi:hypothetical protein
MYVEGDVDLDMAITFKTTKKHTEWEHDEHDEHDEQNKKQKQKNNKKEWTTHSFLLYLFKGTYRISIAPTKKLKSLTSSTRSCLQFTPTRQVNSL